VFLSAHALGFLAHLYCARCAAALARARAHEKVAGYAPRQLHGEVGALRLDDRLLMCRGRNRWLARHFLVGTPARGC
jgi:hypothetical protein